MMTYDEAKNMLGGRPFRKIRPNTFLKPVDDHTIGVRFYSVIIVRIHDDGNYTLDTGGWGSSTTKKRIAAFAPVRIEDGQIVAQFGGAKSEFTDGMMVNKFGEEI